MDSSFIILALSSKEELQEAIPHRLLTISIIDIIMEIPNRNQKRTKKETVPHFFIREGFPYYPTREEFEVFEQGEGFSTKASTGAGARGATTSSREEPYNPFVTERSAETAKTTELSIAVSPETSFDEEQEADRLSPETTESSIKSRNGKGVHPESSSFSKMKEPKEQPLVSLKHEAVLLSLERTFFAALNTAWLIAMGGIGLLSVGDEEEHSIPIGITVFGVSMACCIVALVMHAIRLHQMQTGQSFPHAQSMIWATVICILLFSTLAFQLYFGILYPFLQRTASVKVANPLEATSVFGGSVEEGVGEGDAESGTSP